MSATPSKYSEPVEPTLFVALELSWNEWKLAMTTGAGQAARIRSMPARDLERLMVELEAGKKRLGLSATARVRSCYEAGRDGFWIHRFLIQRGVDNQVVDASSIEVARRFRRAKTDRLDARKLVSMLVRCAQGERVWSVVRVPTAEQEDQRHLQRELEVLKRERGEKSNRIKGLLATVGVKLETWRGFSEQLDQIRTWDGAPLKPGLRRRLEEEWARREFIQVQIDLLEKERVRQMADVSQPVAQIACKLARLLGIGEDSAWLYATELFWRQFANRRQVAGCLGMTPTPYDSGESAREQGISKTGDPRLRARLIQLAWGWLRFQPDSELAQWYQLRFAGGGARQRRIGIVALARKLLIALWRYAEKGIMPTGAVLKEA
jgi:transposase